MILMIQQDESYYFSILSKPCTLHKKNQTDKKVPRLALLMYRQDFERAHPIQQTCSSYTSNEAVKVKLGEK